MQKDPITISDDDLNKLPLVKQTSSASITLSDDELNQLPLAAMPSPFAKKPKVASPVFNPDTAPSSYEGNQVSSITGKPTKSLAEAAGGQRKLDTAYLNMEARGAQRAKLVEDAKAATGDAKKKAIRTLANLGPLSEEEQSALGVSSHYLQSFVRPLYATMDQAAGGIAQAGVKLGVPGSQWAANAAKESYEENTAGLNTSGVRGPTGDLLSAAGAFLPELGVSLLLPESELAHLAYWPTMGGLKAAGRGEDTEGVVKGALSNLTPILGGKIFAGAGRAGSAISNVVLNEGIAGMESGSNQQRMARGLAPTTGADLLPTGLMAGTLGYLAGRTPSLARHQQVLLDSLLKGDLNAPSITPFDVASQESSGIRNPQGSDLQPSPTQGNQTLISPIPSSRTSSEASRGTASQSEASSSGQVQDTNVQSSLDQARTIFQRDGKITIAAVQRELGLPYSEAFKITNTVRGESINAPNRINVRPDQGIPQGPNVQSNPSEVRSQEGTSPISGSGTGEQGPSQASSQGQTQEQVGPGTMKVDDPIAGDAKSNLQQLNETLAAVPVDRTPFEKASIAERILNAATDAKDTLTRSFNSARSAVGSLYEAWRAAPEYTPLNKATGQWLFATARALNASKTFAKEVRTKLPNPAVREAVTNYIQAGGDPLVLEQRAAASKGSLKAGYEAALKLSPNQVTLANNISSYFESQLQKGIDNGLLGNGIENYINQIWENPNTVSKGILAELGVNARLSTDFKYARARVFDSYFEGEQKGFTPATKDISDLIPLYDTAFAKAAAARNYVKSLYGMKAKDGHPLIAFEGIGKVVTQPGDFVEGFQLRPDISSILISPHARPRVDIPVEGKDISYRGSVTKGTKTTVPEMKKSSSGTGTEDSGASTLDYRTINANAFRKHRYVTSAPDGTPVIMEENAIVHPDAYDHLYNNFEAKSIFRPDPNAVGPITPVKVLKEISGKTLDLQNVVKQTTFSLSPFHIFQLGEHALAHLVNPFYNLGKIDYSNPTHQFLIERGLSVGDQNARFLASEGLTGGALVEKVPGIGPYLRAGNEWLFEDYIPRLKMKMAQEALGRNRARYSKELTEDQIGVLTASQANAAFGELNYKYMGRNPSLQDAMRLFLMAPDFLEARGKFAGQAFKPYGREQLRALGIAAATQYLAARVLNKLSDDDYHFEPSSAFALHHAGQRYSIRTVPGDILEGIGSTRQFLYNRTSPILRLGVGTLTGRDYRGTPLSTTEKLKEVGADFLPMSGRSMYEKGLWRGALDSMGFHSKKDISPGVQLAYDYLDARKGTPGTPLEPADQAKQELKRTLRTKRDSGQSIYDEVVKLVADHKLSPAEAHNLIVGKSELYPTFQQLTKSEAIQVWKHLSTKERADVKDLYAEKLRRP